MANPSRRAGERHDRHLEPLPLRRRPGRARPQAGGEKVWKARYDQINRFEKNLHENGTTILKFVLHISREEQKHRLQARLNDPEKRWKFNPADINERGLWDDYQDAYEDAINCCTTDYAPSHMVRADHKWARNLALIETVVRAFKKMKPHYPKLTFDLKDVNIE